MVNEQYRINPFRKHDEINTFRGHVFVCRSGDVVCLPEEITSRGVSRCRRINRLLYLYKTIPRFGFEDVRFMLNTLCVGLKEGVRDRSAVQTHRIDVRASRPYHITKPLIRYTLPGQVRRTNKILASV